MERLDNSKLSPLQKHIVDEMSSEKNVAVIGGPGTGKTVLAISGMGLNGNRKQILITYSNPLSSMIHGCNVTSSTLHSFCWHMAKSMEEELQDYVAEYRFAEDQQKAIRQVINREYGYGETGWPQWTKLASAYNRLSYQAQKDIRYDDIFVDEGQDLPDDAFRFLSLVSDRLIVTFDEAQEVGKENDSGSAKLIRKAGVDCNHILNVLSLQDSFYDLIDNFRNTVAIERVAKLFYNNYGNNNFSLRVVAANRPEGSKPKVIFSALNQQLFDDIADKAYQLNKQIGVIVPDGTTFDGAKKLFDNSVVKNIIPKEKFFYKFAKESNMVDPKVNLNQTGVFLVSFQTSKGMEFDDVYILDCQKAVLQSSSDKNRFYVAATRAKETLTFVFNCRYFQSCPVLNVIKENEGCFDIERKA